MPPQQTGHPAIRNGLIFGAILGVLGLGNTLVQWLAGAYSVSTRTTNGFTTVNLNNTGPSSLLQCVLFLAMLALTFVAGILAARRTGKVGSGSIAGLVTGVVGALTGGIVGLVTIITLVAPGLQAPADSTMSTGQVQALLIGATIFGVIVGLAVDVGIGAGMGALGGLIGANSYRNAAPVAPAQAYPGYPNYPAYPNYPGYSAMSPQAGDAPQQWSYPQPPVYPPQSGNPPPPQQ